MKTPRARDLRRYRGPQHKFKGTAFGSCVTHLRLRRPTSTTRPSFGKQLRNVRWLSRSWKHNCLAFERVSFHQSLHSTLFTLSRTGMGLFNAPGFESCYIIVVTKAESEIYYPRTISMWEPSCTNADYSCT